jgi:hypothetical protein
LLLHFSDKTFKRMAGHLNENAARTPVGVKSANTKLLKLDRVMGTPLWRRIWNSELSNEQAYLHRGGDRRRAISFVPQGRRGQRRGGRADGPPWPGAAGSLAGGRPGFGGLTLVLVFFGGRVEVMGSGWLSCCQRSL